MIIKEIVNIYKIKFIINCINFKIYITTQKIKKKDKINYPSITEYVLYGLSLASRGCCSLSNCI